MSPLQQAKRSLADTLRNEEGFVGIGLFKRGDQDGLRVYVLDEHCAVARRLSTMRDYNGFPILVDVSGPAQADR